MSAWSILTDPWFLSWLIFFYLNHVNIQRKPFFPKTLMIVHYVYSNIVQDSFIDKKLDHKSKSFTS